MRPRLSSRRRSDCGPARGGEGEGGKGRETQTDGEMDRYVSRPGPDVLEAYQGD